MESPAESAARRRAKSSARKIHEDMSHDGQVMLKLRQMDYQKQVIEEEDPFKSSYRNFFVNKESE